MAALTRPSSASLSAASAQAAVYLLDADDRIVETDLGFERFARANDAPYLTEVVGRSLFEFISGTDTKELWRTLLARVRFLRTATTYETRADSPFARRWAELTLVPDADGRVTITSRIVDGEERPWQPLVDRRVARGHWLVMMCSWCKQVRQPSGTWEELEDRFTHPELLPQTPRVAHTVCPACRSVLL